MIKTEYYTVREGRAVKLQSVDLGQGRTEPQGHDVIEIPSRHWWESRRRLVVYPDNSPTPYPLGSPIQIMPNAFGVTDLQNLMGPYLSGLVRRALLLGDLKFTPKEWVIIILTGISAALSAGALWVCVEIARKAGVF